ncbi:pollen-specific protein SF21-like [Rutidosis leptorrhynchoides]|uniref:pollen-specific protein SF21-like n=1 Tax=Rutidosis leptorrhynchoides TaxID=125765 RepID=UPI003A98D713
MAVSGHSISVDLPTVHLNGKEHIIRTGCGSVSVTVYGDQEKPPLITYPDLAQNRLFISPEAASLLLPNFCIYHISPPGHEIGAASIPIDDPVPSVEDLCDQILVVLNHFRLGSVMCMGVMAGAYILTLFAIKYSERVTGLILISPLCREPSWNEWFYNKFMSKLLYYYGMCDLLKEFLIHRYFSKEVCGNLEVPESNMVTACRKLLDERDNLNVWRYLRAFNRRRDITEELENLECKTIIFVGDSSPFFDEALHMTTKLGSKCYSLVEIHACGSMVTEEQPHAMLIPLECFLMRYGFFRPSRFINSPRSPLSPYCINPKLLYPQNMGVKLRPIKTRVSS